MKTLSGVSLRKSAGAMLVAVPAAALLSFAGSGAAMATSGADLPDTHMLINATEKTFTATIQVCDSAYFAEIQGTRKHEGGKAKHPYDSYGAFNVYGGQSLEEIMDGTKKYDLSMENDVFVFHFKDGSGEDLGESRGSTRDRTFPHIEGEGEMTWEKGNKSFVCS